MKKSKKKIAFQKNIIIILLTNVANYYIATFFLIKIFFNSQFMKFIKDSIRELRHVVWPTAEETRKYFIVVVLALILFWIYLFIFSTIFSETLLAIKNFVNPTVTSQETVSISTGNVEISTGLVEEVSTGSTTSTGTAN